MSNIPTPNSILSLSNFAANANMANAADMAAYKMFIINQTTPNVSLTLLNKAIGTVGDYVDIVNNGTENLYVKGIGTTFGTEIQAKAVKRFTFDGTAWIAENANGTEFFCAIRNTAGTWAAINDANHQPHNISNVSVGTHPYQVKVDYNIPNEQVATAIVTPDDTYSQYGINAGISQGVNAGFITLSKQGFGVYISYNGTDWVATLGAGELAVNTDFTFAFSGAGVLTVTHAPIVIHKDVFNISATPRSGVNVSLDSVGSTSFQLVFRDMAGAIITTPTTACRAFVARNGMWKVENDKLGIGSANLWIYGKFKN